MKTIGIIGGMSWESSLEYYRIINEETKKRLGGLHSAEILLNSLDFAQVEALQHRGEWVQLESLMIESALNLEKGGAHMVLIATNTMHKCAPAIEKSLSVPLIHIADAVGERACAEGVNRVALLGTRFTMEEDFYKIRLSEAFGLKVFIPDLEDRKAIHQIIYQELCLGQILPSSRKIFQEIIRKLKEKHQIEGVILGCTEIPLLLKPEDLDIPLFNTTELHAHKALSLALDQKC